MELYEAAASTGQVSAVSNHRQERFNDIIRALRERRGTPALTRFLGCSPRSIRRWLSGQYAPHIKRQRRIEWLWREAEKKATGQPSRRGTILVCAHCHILFHRRNLKAIPSNHVCWRVRRGDLKLKRSTHSGLPRAKGSKRPSARPPTPRVRTLQKFITSLLKVN
ncbi:MAG: hypothetical protein M3R15_11265 [Acidobacteriota bacterium]|nr:hypothetical protein [Acidobacteriota bacterium]